MSDNDVVILCQHVYRKERPAGLIIHHNDGGWQVTCGEADHLEDVSEYVTAHISHFVEHHPETAPLFKMAKGCLAEYNSEEWSFIKHDE